MDTVQDKTSVEEILGKILEGDAFLTDGEYRLFKQGDMFYIVNIYGKWKQVGEFSDLLSALQSYDELTENS